MTGALLALALAAGNHGAPTLCTVSWHSWRLPDGQILNDAYGYKVGCTYRWPERRRRL